MIELGKKERIFFLNSEVDTVSTDVEDFLVANLTTEVSFEEGLNMEGLLNHFGNSREFIYKHFSEHYDKLKSIVTPFRNKNYIGIKFFKKITIEDDFLYITPAYDYITSNEGYEEFRFIGQLPVYVEKKAVFIEEVPGSFFRDTKLNCEVTLLDVLDALFNDLVYDLTEGFTG